MQTVFWFGQYSDWALCLENLATHVVRPWQPSLPTIYRLPKEVSRGISKHLLISESFITFRATCLSPWKCGLCMHLWRCTQIHQADHLPHCQEAVFQKLSKNMQTEVNIPYQQSTCPESVPRTRASPRELQSVGVVSVTSQPITTTCLLKTILI